MFSLRNFLKDTLPVFRKGLEQEIIEKDLDRISGLETKLQNPDSFLTTKNKDLTKGYCNLVLNIMKMVEIIIDKKVKE